MAQNLAGEYELIVVDDCSGDGSAEIARTTPGVQLISATGAGPGAARNLGVAASCGAVLAFTDADCFPHHDWLSEGLASLGRRALVQGAVQADPAAALGPFDRTVWVTGESGLYETANLFVRRSAFDAVGGFEPWIQPDDGKELAEDVWLGWRIRRSGAETAFSDRARVDHAVFERTVRSYLAERKRLRYFPPIVARIPELRHELLFGRYFLSRRSAAFDLAVLALASAAALRSAVPLPAALPYIWMLLGERRWRTRAPRVIGARVLADVVGLMALLRGSLAARSPVL